MTARQGVLCCCLVLLVYRSDSPAQEQPRPTFRTEANYVRVDMYAMRDGAPVEDLRAADIELLEDGVPQKIEAFEYVKVAAAGAQEARREPSSVRDSRSMAEDPRARVVVVFLDTFHVQVDGSHTMRQPLVHFLERAVGDDDLVGLMHPRMSATDLTLGRRTTVIEKLLDKNWTWGEKGRITEEDPQEEQWLACYGQGEIYEEMKARRREKFALDAVEDLIVHLQGMREERKAVLMVSEGWRLFERNERLMAVQLDGRVPGTPEIFVGPEGKLQRRDPTAFGRPSMMECDAARQELATMDNRLRVEQIVGLANRANVSFYPVYPRGLQVTDTPMVTHTTAQQTRASMRALETHLDQLRTLAANTDGLAVVNRNDIEVAMRRIVADLTSYYLLGYYSTNAKPDGKFRRITVKVKRPGVDVRARRGYRAPTREELSPTRAASVSVPSGDRPKDEIDAVNGILYEPDRPVNPVNLESLRHVVAWKRGPSTGRSYVPITEIRLTRTERLRLEHAVAAPGEATARMLDGQGNPMKIPVAVSERQDPAVEHRWVVTDVALAPLAPGEYAIELRVGNRAVATHFRVIP